MRRHRRWAVFVASLVALSGCTRSGKPIGLELRRGTQFESEWMHYRDLPSFKSLAVAGDLRGMYVSGIAHGETSRERAVETAPEYCEARRTDRRVAASCRTYAVDNEHVHAATGASGANGSGSAQEPDPLRP
jgi:hypothetical protein